MIKKFIVGLLTVIMLLGAPITRGGSVPLKHKECTEAAIMYLDGAGGAFEGYAREPDTENFKALPDEIKAKVLRHGQKGWDDVTAQKPATQEEVYGMAQDYYDMCVTSKDI